MLSGLVSFLCLMCETQKTTQPLAQSEHLIVWLKGLQAKYWHSLIVRP